VSGLHQVPGWVAATRCSLLSDATAPRPKGPAAQERGPWARHPIGPGQRRASRDAGRRGLCFAMAGRRSLGTARS
jgi:hypothetical protein